MKFYIIVFYNIYLKLIIIKIEYNIHLNKDLFILFIYNYQIIIGFINFRLFLSSEKDMFNTSLFSFSFKFTVSSSFFISVKLL